MVVDASVRVIGALLIFALSASAEGDGARMIDALRDGISRVTSSQEAGALGVPTRPDCLRVARVEPGATVSCDLELPTGSWVLSLGASSAVELSLDEEPIPSRWSAIRVHGTEPRRVHVSLRLPASATESAVAVLLTLAEASDATLPLERLEQAVRNAIFIDGIGEGLDQTTTLVEGWCGVAGVEDTHGSRGFQRTVAIGDYYILGVSDFGGRGVGVQVEHRGELVVDYTMGGSGGHSLQPFIVRERPHEGTFRVCVDYARYPCVALVVLFRVE